MPGQSSEPAGQEPDGLYPLWSGTGIQLGCLFSGAFAPPILLGTPSPSSSFA